MDTYTGSALKTLGFEARISDLATEGPKAVQDQREKMPWRFGSRTVFAINSALRRAGFDSRQLHLVLPCRRVFLLRAVRTTGGA